MDLDKEEARKEAQQRWVQRAQVSIGKAVTCPLCPDVTPERGINIMLMGNRSQRLTTSMAMQRLARKVVEDAAWMERMTKWLDAFWDEHGHGPRWRTVMETEELWPEEVAFRFRRVVLDFLARRRMLDGTRTPFGLRTRNED